MDDHTVGAGGTTRRASRRPRRPLAVAVLATLIAAAGCSDDDADGADMTTTTFPHLSSTTVATGTSTTGVDDEIVAALDDFWMLFQDLVANPDPADPRLEAALVDPALTAARNELARLRDEGQASRLPDDTVEAHDYEIADITDDEATFRDCWLNDAVIYEVATGAVIDDDVVTALVEGTLVRDGGAWKVMQFSVVDTKDGVLPCDEVL